MNCQKEKMKELMNQVKEIKIGYAQKWLDALKTHERICIFGTGSHGHNWYGILKKYDIKVDGFYENCRWYHVSSLGRTREKYSCRFGN